VKGSQADATIKVEIEPEAEAAGAVLTVAKWIVKNHRRRLEPRRRTQWRTKPKMVEQRRRMDPRRKKGMTKSKMVEQMRRPESRRGGKAKYGAAEQEARSEEAKYEEADGEEEHGNDKTDSDEVESFSKPSKDDGKYKCSHSGSSFLSQLYVMLCSSLFMDHSI
jgi:hypothetical protein